MSPPQTHPNQRLHWPGELHVPHPGDSLELCLAQLAWHWWGKRAEGEEGTLSATAASPTQRTAGVSSSSRWPTAACIATWETFSGRLSAMAHAAAFLAQLLRICRPERAVAGLSVLWVFCGMAIGLTLAQELNLQNLVNTMHPTSVIPWDPTLPNSCSTT